MVERQKGKVYEQQYKKHIAGAYSGGLEKADRRARYDLWRRYSAPWSDGAGHGTDLAADDLPWDTEPEQKTEPPKPKAPAKKKAEQTALTADDLIRVVTQKIKKDRSNKDKVLALLKSYGAAKVSDIPQDKYEAFLTDVSQL